MHVLPMAAEEAGYGLGTTQTASLLVCSAQGDDE